VSKAFRFIPALGAVLFALIALAACGGSGIPGNAVANVGGTAIPLSAVKHWVAVASQSSQTSFGKPVTPEPPNYTACIANFQKLALSNTKNKHPAVSKIKKTCEEQYKQYVKEVMGFLLTSQWVLGEANELGIHISDSEVHKQFEKIIASQFTKAGELEKFIASSGQTVSDLLLRVKLNVLSAKIQAKIVKEGTTVTNARMEKYYKENQSKFGVQEKRDVYIILTKTEAAATAAKKEILAGKSFSSVAEKVSTDPTSRANGGLLTEVVKGEEEKPLGEEIFIYPVGALSPVVKTTFGYYIFKVKSITPGSKETFAQAKSAIKTQLSETGQQEALSKFVKAFKKKWTAKSDCSAGYIVADCKQYKKPKTSSSTESSTSE